MTRQEFLLSTLRRFCDTSLEIRMRKTHRPVTMSHHGLTIGLHFGPSMNYDITIWVENEEIVSTTVPIMKRAISKGWTVKG